MLTLVLEGEDPQLVAGPVAQKRIGEYMKLTWRAMGGRPRATSFKHHRLEQA